MDKQTNPRINKTLNETIVNSKIRFALKWSVDDLIFIIFFSLSLSRFFPICSYHLFAMEFLFIFVFRFYIEIHFHSMTISIWWCRNVTIQYCTYIFPIVQRTTTNIFYVCNIVCRSTIRCNRIFLWFFVKIFSYFLSSFAIFGCFSLS